MSKESTTPDLVELTRQTFEISSRDDLDAILRFYAPEAVWDASATGIGTFEGVAAIRAFLEDWFGNYEEYEIELEEIHDLGGGVVFVLTREHARPPGSLGRVYQRTAWVNEWVEGVVVRVSISYDIDEARGRAERLATERAQADA